MTIKTNSFLMSSGLRTSGTSKHPIPHFAHANESGQLELQSRAWQFSGPTSPRVRAIVRAIASLPSIALFYFVVAPKNHDAGVKQRNK